ncbi:MAG: GNAT family protein [Ferruginibacter sp.]
MKEFKLRPWHINDLESLVEQANNFKIARFLTDGFPHPYTKENGRAFIEMASKDNPIHIFAIEIDEKAVGGIGLHPQTDIMKKNAELGYWLGEAFWGKGIITAAVKQVVKFGFETYDITRIYARPYGSNTASKKVLEKAGFVLEARIEKNIFKNGEFLDELIYGIRRP